MISVEFRNRHVPLLLALLRIAAGWHFLYEGLIKVLDPSWTARWYLEGSRWIFGDFFRWIASDPSLLSAADFLNSWGLTLTGLALMLGLFTRFASWTGIVMLAAYYLAYPPFGIWTTGAINEGNYFIVSKNIIELLALLVLGFTQSGRFYGLDFYRTRKTATPTTEGINSVNTVAISDSSRRRDLIKSLAGLPFLALFSGGLIKSLSGREPDAVSGATIKLDFKKLDELEGKLPTGQLCGYEVSRLIMGCNLISGYAHARDLKYANQLFKAYNDEKRILNTLHLAEMAGINTTFTVNRNYPYIRKYLKIYDGRMQTIYQVYIKEDNFFGDIDLAISNGANLLYIQGAESDRYVREGKSGKLAEAVEYIKKKGFPAGVGAHSLEVIKTCEKEGIPADFYVKTFHHDNYWSAHPRENRTEFSVDTKRYSDHNMIHDNIFDLFPEQTAEFMKSVRKPWIAFKVLAAGAIAPKDGFRYAFENGADFICVGMFDFQIVEDVNLACEITGSLKNRERGWYS